MNGKELADNLGLKFAGVIDGEKTRLLMPPNTTKEQAVEVVKKLTAEDYTRSGIIADSINMQAFIDIPNQALSDISVNEVILAKEVVDEIKLARVASTMIAGVTAKIAKETGLEATGENMLKLPKGTTPEEAEAMASSLNSSKLSSVGHLGDAISAVGTLGYYRLDAGPNIPVRDNKDGTFSLDLSEAAATIDDTEIGNLKTLVEKKTKLARLAEESGLGSLNSLGHIVLGPRANDGLAEEAVKALTSSDWGRQGIKANTVDTGIKKEYHIDVPKDAIDGIDRKEMNRFMQVVAQTLPLPVIPTDTFDPGLSKDVNLAQSASKGGGVVPKR